MNNDVLIKQLAASANRKNTDYDDVVFAAAFWLLPCGGLRESEMYEIRRRMKR